MSFDLLAEFDSFYRAPQSSPANNSAAISKTRPVSALEDLSSLGNPSSAQNKPSQSQVQWNASAPGALEDVWGDFEAMSVGNLQHTSAISTFNPRESPHHRESSDGTTYQDGASRITGYAGNLHDGNQSGGQRANPTIIRRPTIDLFSSNVASLAESTPVKQHNSALPSNSSSRTASTYIKTATHANDKGNVLFDAGDELSVDEDDDDFGDFETVSSPHPQPDQLPIESPIQAVKPTKRPSELLTAHEGLQKPPFPYPQAPKSPSFKERNPFADLAVTTPAVPSTTNKELKTESPVTAWPVYEEKISAADIYHDSPALNDDEEDWGEFEDLPAETKSNIRIKTGIEIDAWAWDTADNQHATISAPQAEAPPPTNIPPPSVLLAVFPQLFNLPQSSLFQAVANQTYSLKTRILSDPSTIDFLRAYLLLATVAARIVAGRKLRWKRDIHLSQAMKIGPAVAHGKGGMKLIGIDKAESVREEREVADLVRIWRDQVGRLRSAVAAANSSIHDQSAHLAVPDITETMIVKTNGTVLTAPKACIICGLKREERIPKVDFQVEDSFGEWWVEHWGHRACRNFWEEHESTLKQR